MWQARPPALLLRSTELQTIEDGLGRLRYFRIARVIGRMVAGLNWPPDLGPLVKV